MKFVQAFDKTAAAKLPATLHKMHLQLDSRKYSPGYSKKRVSEMLKRRAK